MGGARLTFKLDVSDVGSPGTKGSRSGTLLADGRRDISTPNILAVSSRGIVPHLTPDVLAQQDSTGGVYMALEDFIERAQKGVPPILKCPTRDGSPRLHTFTALPSSFSTVLAPRRIPPVTAPNGNTDRGVSAFTSVGFYDLTAKSYSDYVDKLQPDIVVSMADLPSSTPYSKKRIPKMESRTENWLDELVLSLKNSTKEIQPAIFASVLPLSASDQAEYLEHIDFKQSSNIHGLAFYSADVIPDMPESIALSSLPRLSLAPPSSPGQVLRQISLGMDLFTIPFINFATDSGLAFNFQFGSPGSKETSPKPLAKDMFSPALARDTGPLLTGCTCYACTEHHGAFITHLLAAKEMLGWVLLQIHNHHIMSDFFSAIRSTIKDGTFEAKRQEFEREFESNLPEGTGQKPRVRGYHFKTEGPGEGKRNAAAWGFLGDD